MPDDWGMDKHVFKCWGFPASQMGRDSGDPQVDIADDIACPSCQTATEPERDHLLMLPECPRDGSKGVLLREIGQLLQVQ